MTIELTERDVWIFDQTLKTGDLNIFTSNYFILPYSGTKFTAEDTPDDYGMFHEMWLRLGKPDQEMEIARLDGTTLPLKVMWGMGSDPIFLHHHGYLLNPWVQEMILSGKRISVVCGGTGSGKTSSQAIIGLTKCAMIEGFDFLNVAPTETQASDILTDVRKWVANSEFEKFVVRPRSGELFKLRPFPTMVIQVGEYRSTFSCMTVGVHGNYILGKEKDRIHIDEAGLLEGIGEAVMRLVTRLRGERITGRPRTGELAFSSNPHDNPSFDRLADKAKKEWEDNTEDGLYFYAEPGSEDNVAITKSQVALHVEFLESKADQARWLHGSRETTGISNEIPTVLIKACHDPLLDAQMEKLVFDDSPAAVYKRRDGLGVIHWQLPWQEGRTYIALGDPGTASPAKMTINNVPVVIVLDASNFPSEPAAITAFHWIDGNGKYGPWKSYMKEMMDFYDCIGAYDATGTQGSFAESEDFRDYILWPITLAGGQKALGKTMFKMFCSDGLFAWPYLEGLWYQARIYREFGAGVKKLADDIISTLFVGSLMLRSMFYSELPTRYKTESEQTEEMRKAIEDDMLAAALVHRGDLRYTRGTSGRYGREAR